MINVFHDVTLERLADRRLRVLAEASSLLASSLDSEVTLPAVAAAVVPAIAGRCTIALVEPDGVRRVAEAGDPALAPTVTVDLTARGATIGSLALSPPAGRSLAAEDAELAQELARRVAVAVDNVRLHREMREAATLLDLLFATAPVGIAFVDREHRYVGSTPRSRP